MRSVVVVGHHVCSCFVQLLCRLPGLESGTLSSRHWQDAVQQLLKKHSAVDLLVQTHQASADKVSSRERSFVLSLCSKRPISDLYSLRFHVPELTSNNSDRITRSVTSCNSLPLNSACMSPRNTLDLLPSQQHSCARQEANPNQLARYILDLHAAIVTQLFLFRL